MAGVVSYFAEGRRVRTVSQPVSRVSRQTGGLIHILRTRAGWAYMASGFSIALVNNHGFIFLRSQVTFLVEE